MEQPSDRTETIANLEKRLADLIACLPAHSIPPSLLIEIEEVEEQLAELRAFPSPGSGKRSSP